MAGHVLPDLPYTYEALEPHVDARALKLHHRRIHQAHVDRLNTTLAELEPSLRELPVEELLRRIDEVPEDFRSAVRNHGGGHANHSLLWTSLSPGGGGKPEGQRGNRDLLDLAPADVLVEGSARPRVEARHGEQDQQRGGHEIRHAVADCAAERGGVVHPCVLLDCGQDAQAHAQYDGEEHCEEAEGGAHPQLTKKQRCDPHPAVDEGLAQVPAKNTSQPARVLLRKRLVEPVVVKQFGFTCGTALPLGEECVAGELVNPDEDD